MKYLLKNPRSGKWLSDGLEVAEPDEVNRLFSSKMAALACARVLGDQNKRLNKMYTTAMFPEAYEVVPFTLVQL